MTKFGMKTFASLAATMTAMLALAQPGGPPPGGGPGAGARFGGGMGMMMGGPFLLMRADVQKELGLTADQVAKLKKLAPQGGMMGRGPGGPGGGPGGPPTTGGRPGAGGGPGTGPGMGPGGGNPMAMMQEMRKKVAAILTKPQATRLEELGLQRQGPMAVLRPDVGKKLGVTEDQRKKILEGLQTFRPAPSKAGEPPKMPSRDEMRAMMKKANDKALGLLTADQKKRWQAMLGKPFKFKDPT